MLDIDKNWVKELAGDTIYRRGYNCYENNQIKELNVDYENEDGNIVIKVNAIVRSSSTNEDYAININLVNGTNNVRLNCNCKYWGVFCEHSVAVLLKLIEEKDTILEKLKDKHDKGFLMDIKHNITEENLNIEKKYLNTSYKLHIENIKMHTVSLEIKVGEDKLYVVKNIKEFIEKISRKEDIYFGKSFILNPHLHIFREDDEKIINFLIEIYEIQNKLEEFADVHNHGIALNSKLLKGKKIYLTESNIIKFFNVLRHRKIGLKMHDEDMGEVEIIKEDFPLDFTIKLEEDRIYLKQLSKVAIPITASGEFLLYENKIYEPTPMLLKNYRPFFNAFINSNKPEISIDKKYSEDMASYVLPALRKVSNSINIDESFKERFYEEKLKTVIYLDKDRGKVIAKFIFQYDDIKINPLSKTKDKRKEDKVLVRDLKGEEEVLNVFKLYGFIRENSTYVLENEEKILKFILSGIESLQGLGEVYYSESFKNIKIYNSSNYRSSIKLNDEDLLEFSFSIDGIDKRELKDIFKSIREKKKYHRLKEGGFISLVDNSIKDIAKLMSHLNINPSQLEKNTIILPKYNALYLDNCLKEKEISFVEKNKRFRELINNIKDIGDIDYKVPSNLTSIMRPYQKFGFKWLKTLAHCGLGGILSDEMGLGKTLQSIAFIKSEVDENKDRKPSIVVCPTSLVYNWQDEINKFQPDLKCLVISGNKEEREEQVELIKDVDVVITSYALIRRDIEDYQNINFRYCFLDEAQNIKNANSLSAQSVKCINAQAKFALTGTPIENSIKELWSIFDFIMPGYLFTITKFAQKYEIPIIRNNNEELLEDLGKKIKPFILRRLKKNVIKELPPKIEHNVMVDMSEEQKKVYASFVQQAKDEMEYEIQENGFNKSKLKILAILTRLRQICCDPSTFIEDFNGESGKMEAVLNIINNNISEGHKILIFSQFTSVLKNLSKKLEDNSIKYSYLDGSTKAEHRGKLVKEFNESNIGVFLISLKAGGTGLNLTSADIVIHFDPWWNPAVENQASDRAHRIGQKNTVEVIRLIAKGTIEEKIYKIQEKKKKIIENVIDKNVGEELLISSLEKDDIEQLFL